jgi:hypothetical protein
MNWTDFIKFLIFAVLWFAVIGFTGLAVAALTNTNGSLENLLLINGGVL